MRKTMAIAILLATVSYSAFAADMPRQASAPSYTPAAPVPFTWTGLYLGASGGYGTSLTDGIDFKGVSAGGQLGFNYQWNMLVAGIEADGNWANVGQSTTIDGITTQDTIKSFGTVHGRLGFAFDRTLFYGLAGVALADNTLSVSGVGIDSVSASKLHTGYVVGGGIEHAITNNVSLRGEYQFASYGSQDYFGVASGKVDVQTFKLGLNYLFH
jgi:outer membrane immunogenic protein